MANMRQQITISNLSNGKSKYHFDYFTDFTVIQTDFDRKLAICNSGKLVRAMVEAFKALYKKYPEVTDRLPDQVMYRCFLLAQLLLVFEIYAVVHPEELTVDPFEVL